MVRGVLGVGLGLVGSFAWLEPGDFVRDRGVRDLDEVTASAEANGFVLDRVVEMPANNLSVIFRLTH